jgi:hypothetical protein
LVDGILKCNLARIGAGFEVMDDVLTPVVVGSRFGGPNNLLFHDSFGKYVGLAFTIPKSVLEALYENSRSPCGSGGIGKSESYKKFGVS